MTRSLHRWFGLIAAIALCLTALSGATLSIFPVADAVTNPASQQISVATLAARVQAAEPTVEQIKQEPSGRIVAFYFDGNTPVSSIIDPATGAPVGEAGKSDLERWLIDFHRAYLVGDNGRYAAAIVAGLMLALSISGAFLLARRAGGWRHILKPVSGKGQSRLHTIVSRIAVPALFFSSITALWMVAATFDVLPAGSAAPMFPETVSGKMGFDLAAMEPLQNTQLDEFRSLTFPYANDPTDAYRLKTSAGEGYIDQGNGALLEWSDANWVDKTTHLATVLHTGQGMAWLGLILGVSALGVPVLGWTGTAMWLRGRKGPKIASVAEADADTIVLVGSEGGTTWGFAATLQTALMQHNLKTYVGPMNTFDPARWPHAKRLILLAATYGDGAAPSTASGFAEKFSQSPARSDMQLAILGFGDRSFAHYCGFASELTERAEKSGWKTLVPFETVNRQSPQDFARWGRALAGALDLDFELNHVPALPKTWRLTLISRRDYGADVQAHTTILRFALPHASLADRLTGKMLPKFEAGDLVAIVPEGSNLPRFYSLASGSKDGFLEICVRKHPGGLCSNQLTAMEPGQEITAFIRANPDFRPARGKRPVVLIGAGTGIGPLAGFARANQNGRPMHLYFGARHPASDALYDHEIAEWKADGRLTTVATAYSRLANPLYVQDTLKADAANLAKLMTSGAQILVCGGREMAEGVAAAVAEIVEPHGLNLKTLKAEGRYAEDVY